jgi:cyclopropane fatty-acyl-phospholipid synthase-like methyltransferase
MPNPAVALITKTLGPLFLPRLKQQVTGLANDFWKDGPENLLTISIKRRRKQKKYADVKKEEFVISDDTEEEDDDVSERSSSSSAGRPGGRRGRRWHAQPGEISEKMWGSGFVTPGDKTINGMMIKPLGLTKEMSVLDLSAGLGGRLRTTVEETGAYMTGLEPDAGIARRGMELSVRAGKSKHAPIRHYDPSNLKLDRLYDCVLARETFYRVPDRQAFMASISKHSKPHAQIAYTDYIVDPEYQETPAILKWKQYEKLANPEGIVAMSQSWAKVGFNIRVHEDLTDIYSAEVKVGINKLMEFIAKGTQPDRETLEAILRRVEIWKYRLKAMENGMKFYRFYGTKS